MTGHTLWFALLCLTVAVRVPLYRTGSPRGDVNEHLISEMTQELQSAKVVSLEHQIDYRVPVSFTTKLPCRLRLRAGSFEKRLGSDSVRPFATALGISQLLTDARGFRGSPCRGDTARIDVVTVTFGKGKKAVRASIDFHGGTTTYTWRDSTPVVVRLLGTKSDSVRQLLMQSMPEDSFLTGIRLCDRTDAEELDGPDRPYIWVESVPEATVRVPPVYPETARLKGVSGEVTIQALINESGTVASTIIIRSIPALDEAAVHAVEQWRFRPAMVDGAPTSVWVAIPVKFRLR